MTDPSIRAPCSVLTCAKAINVRQTTLTFSWHNILVRWYRLVFLFIHSNVKHFQGGNKKRFTMVCPFKQHKYRDQLVLHSYQKYSTTLSLLLMKLPFLVFPGQIF